MFSYAVKYLHRAGTIASATARSSTSRSVPALPGRLGSIALAGRSGPLAATSRFKSTYGPLLGRHTSFPKRLFRVNAGKNVVLRNQEDQHNQGRGSYDLVLHDGLVLPAEGNRFKGPNGASMRPNTYMMQEIIRNFYAPEVVVYEVPADTKLPNDLVLLHEHTDHYSLQCASPMTLDELNRKVTFFLQKNGTLMTQDEFVTKYPFESATSR